MVASVGVVAVPAAEVAAKELLQQQPLFSMISIVPFLLFSSAAMVVAILTHFARLLFAAPLSVNTDLPLDPASVVAAAGQVLFYLQQDQKLSKGHSFQPGYEMHR